mgnify:CR=1 FL=1
MLHKKSLSLCLLAALAACAAVVVAAITVAGAGRRLSNPRIESPFVAGRRPGLRTPSGRCPPPSDAEHRPAFAGKVCACCEGVVYAEAQIHRTL